MDDTTLRRREFLARTAAAAGLAGLSSLPAGTLIAEAARAQATGLPSPRNLPLDHVVVVMMENRSFDHYLGWLEGADGSQDETYVTPAGEPVATRHASSLEAQWQGCGHPDPGHGWEAGRSQLQGGFLADGSGNDEFALTYYDEGEIEFLHAAAGEYTVYDRFFCSLLGPTWPNRYYKWSAQSGGHKDNSPPLETAGNQWETIFDRASDDLDEDFGQMGFRIPAVAISPFARGGGVRHAQLGFESIIKLISYRFGLGHLTVRDRYATNAGATFDWERTDFEPPDLPDPEHVASRPCTLGGGDVLTRESAAAHVSDLAELERLAERFGFSVPGGRVEDLFSAPDAIRRAVSGGG